MRVRGRLPEKVTSKSPATGGGQPLQRYWGGSSAQGIGGAKGRELKQLENWNSHVAAESGRDEAVEEEASTQIRKSL